MTTRITIILLLTFLGQICFGQDTIFLDSKWKPTSRTKADYFRIEKKEGSKWIRMDYYFKSKKLQMKGAYLSLTPEKEDGYFEWHHETGKLKHKGNYENGKQIGEHLWYSEHGSLEARENYKDGELNGAYEEYYPNGKLINKSSFINGLQDGRTVYYREDGSKQSEGNFKNGNKDGEWKYYDKSGKIEGTETFKIAYEIKEAKMFLQLPNDNWSLTDHSGKDMVKYIFKRNEIEDSSGSKIIPAIMLYIEDAKDYKQDATLFSINKRVPFMKNGIKIEKTLIQSDKDYPLPYKNAYFIKALYTDKGNVHIFYMIHILTKDDKGIQLYMDMPKSIASEYENEFWTTINSIKEL